MHRALGGLIVALLLGVAPRVRAQPEASALPLPPAVQARLDEGIRLYGQGRHAEALRAFQAGYDLEPRPVFLYAMGQAARAMGNCPRAIDYFGAFLRTLPPARQVEKARVQIARCERQRLSASRPPATAPAVAPPPARPPPPPSPPAPWLGRAQLHATGFAEVLAQRGGAQVGGGLGLGRFVDVGAAAVLGEWTGARLLVGLHPARGRGRRLQPLLEVRGLIHPIAGTTALGGGLEVGATLELGRGRIRVGVAGEAFTAPAGFRPYAVIVGGGYELDVWRRANAPR